MPLARYARLPAGRRRSGSRRRPTTPTAGSPHAGNRDRVGRVRGRRRRSSSRARRSRTTSRSRSTATGLRPRRRGRSSSRRRRDHRRPALRRGGDPGRRLRPARGAARQALVRRRRALQPGRCAHPREHRATPNAGAVTRLRMADELLVLALCGSHEGWAVDSGNRPEIRPGGRHAGRRRRAGGALGARTDHARRGPHPDGEQHPDRRRRARRHAGARRGLAAGRRRHGLDPQARPAPAGRAPAVGSTPGRVGVRVPAARPRAARNDDVPALVRARAGPRS